jgi:hypothetical protein
VTLSQPKRDEVRTGSSKGLPAASLAIRLFPAPLTTLNLMLCLFRRSLGNSNGKLRGREGRKLRPLKFRLRAALTSSVSVKSRRMRHNRFDQEHFSKGYVYLSLGHSLNRVVPFRIQDKAVRNAIDN